MSTRSTAGSFSESGHAGLSFNHGSTITVLPSLVTNLNEPWPSQVIFVPFVSNASLLSDPVTAIDRNRYPGHEIRSRRGEKHRRAGVILRLTPAAHRRATQHL